MEDELKSTWIGLKLANEAETEDDLDFDKVGGDMNEEADDEDDEDDDDIEQDSDVQIHDQQHERHCGRGHPGKTNHQQLAHRLCSNDAPRYHQLCCTVLW